jgi:HEAT repeat protein
MPLSFTNPKVSMHVRMCVTAGLCLSLLLVGCKSDPATVEHWEKRIEGAKTKKEKIKAVEDLRNSKYLTAAMLPMLRAHLAREKAPEVKAAIVRLLGEQKDVGALSELENVMDPGASDSESKSLNKELAIALGRLGDPKGVATLTKLLKTKDNYTVIAACEALGALQAKEAFAPLYDLATDDTVEPFITKKAIEALGEIADPRSIPGLIKAMFKDRKGVSFYRESSFALYKLGQPAADAMVPVVDRSDKALSAWADQNNIKDIALMLKGAQLVGDFHDLRAEKALLGYLGYKTEFDDLRLLVRMQAADALGRMRSKEAVKPVAALLTEEDPVARKAYVWALARIGNKDALPKLVESAGKGPWDSREESIRGTAMLGDDPAPFAKFTAAEQKLFEAECADAEGQGPCKDVADSVKKHVEKIKAYALRAEAGKACKSDATCWAKKLDDPNEGVRERAAYEVGRSGNASLVGELMKRLREKNLDTRLAFIQGADWLIDSKAALAEAKALLPALTTQIAEERGKTEYDRVNEDLKRLHVKIAR